MPKNNRTLLEREKAKELQQRLVRVVQDLRLIREFTSAFIRTALPLTVSSYLSGTATTDQLSSNGCSSMTEVCVPGQASLASRVGLSPSIHATQGFAVVGLTDIVSRSTQLRDILLRLIDNQLKGLTLPPTAVSFDARLIDESQVIVSPAVRWTRCPRVSLRDGCMCDRNMHTQTRSDRETDPCV